MTSLTQQSVENAGWEGEWNPANRSHQCPPTPADPRAAGIRRLTWQIPFETLGSEGRSSGTLSPG